jgi:hypothetical protein
MSYLEILALKRLPDEELKNEFIAYKIYEKICGKWMSNFDFQSVLLYVAGRYLSECKLCNPINASSKELAKDENVSIVERVDYQVLECKDFEVRLMVKYIGVLVDGKLRLMRVTGISSPSR